MSMTKRNILSAFGLCALLLPMTVGAKNQVARPLTIRCTGTTDLVTGAAFMWGVATHSGVFTNEAQLTGPSSARGRLVGANGDEVHWDATFTNTPISSNEWLTQLTVTVTGGTGRFEGASGGFTAEYVETIDWDTLTTTYSFTGTGTITY